ncbi:hypothetical protein [Paracoccus aminophilus]|uniref:Uncharacterized protein n=1 Tax=Paracoccus aminophilus JCM 7686 TaxID=1367847 RepID=S5XM03_PARAH|nr:hypothetical protein [Paracoccus aminophilus]AGT08299.1 hypothetical protein JCM7686_1190 [Paracoccus aminophilus JCM 7686]
MTDTLIPPLTPLTRSDADALAALDWTFVLAEIGAVDLTTLCCAPKPWPVDPPLYPRAYQALSAQPRLCNFGLVLFQPGTREPRKLPRHLLPPPGWHVAGLSSARAPGPGPHPFAQFFAPEERALRQDLRDAILNGQPLPEAPATLLRAILRELSWSHPALIRPLAERYDPALFLSL